MTISYMLSKLSAYVTFRTTPLQTTNCAVFAYAIKQIHENLIGSEVSFKLNIIKLFPVAGGLLIEYRKDIMKPTSVG